MSTTSTYVVTGMTCSHCVHAVTEEVSALDGVTDVRVVLDGGVLTIVSDSDIPFADIERAVDEAGYTVAAGS